MIEPTPNTCPLGSEEFPRPTLAALALLFLRLGATAFGGPAAHIAMMEDEVVTRRRWLSREKFLDLLAATNLIPGPNSTELAIHIGLLAGWWGLIISGVCFILPAAVLVTAIAWVYVEFNTLPQVAGILYGVKPVIIAVVLQALWKLGRDSVKDYFLAAVGLLAVVLETVALNELLVLLAAGLIVMGGRLVTRRHAPKPPPATTTVPALSILPATGAVAAGGATAAMPFGLWPLFLFFLKVGSVLFGSGYVLLAFLRADLVERWHWLTEGELLDAVAVGQVTPGPVFTTATFIGYVLGARHGAGGVAGALVATVGIFLPAFFFVAISGPLVPRLRQSRLAGDFLDGVVVASLALMAVVTWQLGRAALVPDGNIDLLALALAVVSGFLLLRYRLNSAWLVLGGALIGLAVSHAWLGETAE